MRYIHQKHLQNLRQLVAPGKVVVICGPRRVGKTTLVKEYLKGVTTKSLFVDADDIVVREYLESQSISKLRDFVGDHTLLVVDEAQHVAKIGGSSSLDLAKDAGEPLTGRKVLLTLFPLAQMEISTIEKPHETQANLESRLIYGSYPEVVTMRSNADREEYLRELISSYLFKDILALEGIRYANKLVRLLQLLAFQIGKEVSLTEVGAQLGMSKNTVERYLDLLESTDSGDSAAICGRKSPKISGAISLTLESAMH